MIVHEAGKLTRIEDGWRQDKTRQDKTMRGLIGKWVSRTV